MNVVHGIVENQFGLCFFHKEKRQSLGQKETFLCFSSEPHGKVALPASCWSKAQLEMCDASEKKQILTGLRLLVGQSG